MRKQKRRSDCSASILMVDVRRSTVRCATCPSSSPLPTGEPVGGEPMGVELPESERGGSSVLGCPSRSRLMRRVRREERGSGALACSRLCRLCFPNPLAGHWLR